MGKDLYYKCLTDKKIQTLISALKNIEENYKIHSDFPENETTLCHLNLNLKIFYIGLVIIDLLILQILIT